MALTQSNRLVNPDAAICMLGRNLEATRASIGISQLACRRLSAPPLSQLSSHRHSLDTTGERMPKIATAVIYYYQLLG